MDHHETVPALCRHFGVCGGCTTQDVPPAIAAADKRNRLIDALTRAGFTDPPVAPTISIPMHTRRRVDFAAMRVAGAVRLGFHAARSRDVTDITECPLAIPAIETLIAPLRTLLARLSAFRKSASIKINALETGLDVSIILDAEATAADRTWLIAFARDQSLARISLGEEPVLVLRDPTLKFGPLTITPPPGAFLQPTVEGEAAIRTAILAGLPAKLTRKSRIVELYAGIGTITGALAGALADHARIEAYEGNKPAAAALAAAIRNAALASRITIQPRDLTRRPVTAKELSGAACLILNPPFDGAGPQIPPILEAKIPRILYISCNPEALTREATRFRQSHYHLHAATPIDQFPGSHHLESVIVLTASSRSG